MRTKLIARKRYCRAGIRTADNAMEVRGLNRSATTAPRPMCDLRERFWREIAGRASLIQCFVGAVNETIAEDGLVDRRAVARGNGEDGEGADSVDAHEDDFPALDVANRQRLAFGTLSEKIKVIHHQERTKISGKCPLSV